jgi:hypothetical protein
MIDRDYCGVYSLTCDICGSEADETFFEFYDAVEYKKQNGWRSQKYRGEWEDVCPECQELTRHDD